MNEQHAYEVAVQAAIRAEAHNLQAAAQEFFARLRPTWTEEEEHQVQCGVELVIHCGDRNTYELSLRPAQSEPAPGALRRWPSIWWQSVGVPDDEPVMF